MTNPHVDFIIAAYAITAVVVAAIIGALVLDYRAQRLALMKFDSSRDLDETP
jgi:heme exporter protein CcmD